MEAPYFKINGIDILPYTEDGGIKWQRNDLDGPNAGRTMDGVMNRDRLGMKIRWDFTERPLRTEYANIVLNAIYPEYVQVETNIDPMFGTYTKTFYSNNIPATCMTIDAESGVALWSGISFPLIER